MKIFIHGGLNTGQCIDYWSKHNRFKNLQYSQIHLFEPNPSLIPLCKEKINKIDDGRITFHEEAIWTNDGYLEFYLSNTTRKLGSSYIKRDCNDNMPTKVPCIDLSKFLCNFPNDYIIADLDLEGSELPVLEKCIKMGTIHLIKELTIEFHPQIKEHDNSNNRIDNLKNTLLSIFPNLKIRKI